MRCAAVARSDILGLHAGLAGYSDALLQGMIDSSLEFIFGALGHTFGQAIRIWYEGAGTVVTVTVLATGAVATDGVILTVDGVVTTLLFADYETIAELVSAIEDLDDWEADPVIDWVLGQPTAGYLRPVAATAITSGYENRLVLCFSHRYECHFGRGESHLFLHLPIHEIASVIEDTDTLTAADEYWVDSRGWLIRKGCAGGIYYPYTRDVWSQREPNNVHVKYVPRYYLVRPRVLLEAVGGLVLLKATATGFKSERIGDYSYQKDGTGDVALWIWTLRRYQRTWQPRAVWNPGMN